MKVIRFSYCLQLLAVTKLMLRCVQVSRKIWYICLLLKKMFMYKINVLLPSTLYVIVSAILICKFVFYMTERMLQSVC